MWILWCLMGWIGVGFVLSLMEKRIGR